MYRTKGIFEADIAQKRAAADKATVDIVYGHEAIQPSRHMCKRMILRAGTKGGGWPSLEKA
jgi:hypothetical protein